MYSFSAKKSLKINKLICAKLFLCKRQKELAFQDKVLIDCQADCLFCQFANQKKPIQVVAKFLHCFAIEDQYPVSKGHLLIIPYEHTSNWFTARKQVRLDMLNALQLLKEQTDRKYKPDGYNIGANCGEVAGQTIMHLHLHLIPRYKGDMQNPRGGVRGVIPAKQAY